MSNPTQYGILPKIVQGMRFLRDVGIIHMNMNFDNVLIARNLMPKLSGFGNPLIHTVTDRC